MGKPRVLTVVDNLTITTEPGTVHAVTAVRGIASAASITVSGVIRDSLNAPITDSARTVTIAILNDPQTSGAAATLSGTASVQSNAADGTYSFTGLSLNKENTTTFTFRVTCETKTKDTAAFCVYHPVFNTAPYTSADYLMSLCDINTVDPTGVRTLTITGGNVSRKHDPLNHAIYKNQATSGEQCPEPAWNAACAFGADDGYDEAVAALVTVVGTQRDTFSVTIVADAVDRTAASGTYVDLRVNDTGTVNASLYCYSVTGGLASFYCVDYRDGNPHIAENTALDAIAENTPFFGMFVSPRNAALKAIVGANTATGDTGANVQTSALVDKFCVGMRSLSGSPAYIGALDTTNPRMFAEFYHNGDQSANAVAWRSALGTALGLSL